MSDPRKQALDDFRRRCKEQGLAFTFQRQVIYEAVVDSREHPTPELIYEQVRQRIPSDFPGHHLQERKDVPGFRRPQGSYAPSRLAAPRIEHDPASSSGLFLVQSDLRY